MSLSDERRRTWTLILCCLTQFMVILDVAIVNVALPAIRDDLHVATADLHWVVNAYTLTFAGLLLLGGRAADLLGRREVFVAGLVVFALTSLLGGLAQSGLMLVIARGLQGIGGALVAPATLAILMTTFREGAERNRALGFWGSTAGLGGTAGSVLGGVLTDGLSWRWILFINVPIGLVAAVVAWRVIVTPRPRREGRAGFDLPGALVVTVGLVALTYGIVSTEHHPWTSAETLVPLLGGVGLLALFVLIEGRLSRAPLMPLRILRSRSVSAGNVVVMCMAAATFSMWYLVSLYLQQSLHYSALETGLCFVPMALTVFVCSQLAGRLSSRIGGAPVLVGGMTLIALGLFGFSRVSPDGSFLGDTLGPGVVTAMGLGFSYVPVTILAMTGVRGAESGVVSGLLNTFRQIGGSIGLAVLATIASNRAASGGDSVVALTDGFRLAFTVGGCIAATGAFVALTVLARRPARAASPAASDASG